MTPKILRWLSAFGLLFSLFASPSHAWEPLVRAGRCTNNNASCNSTIGSVGSGCCSPETSESCPTTTRCQGTPLRWPQNALPLKWYLVTQKLEGTEGWSQLALADIETALKNAWTSWEVPSCTSFRQTYVGQIQRQPNPRDGVVTLYLATSQEWAQIGFPGEVLAFSNPTQQPSAATIFDGDIVFNPNPSSSWGVPGKITEQQLDLAAVAQHEIGHSLGLGHSRDGNAVMYYRIRKNGALFGALTKDDQEAICTLYPANLCKQDLDCGPCRSCNAQGRCADNVSAQTNLCKACSTDAECGNNGICENTWQGGRCTFPCSSQDCCPQGYTCQPKNGAKRCIPIKGSCDTQPCPNDAACGKDGACVQSACKNATYSFSGLCKRECSQDSDCNGDEGCALLANAKRRCAKRCPEGWCPAGFQCRSQQGGDVCLPEDPRICPCTGDPDCPTGQSCLQGFCQRPDGNLALEPCSNQVSCRAGMTCLSINQEPRCVRICGAGSSVALGNGGMPCYQGFCGAGLSCADIPNIGPLCMKTCSQDSDCAGASCRAIGNNKYCLCQQDSQCVAGERCQSAFLSSIQAGACSTQSADVTCAITEVCTNLMPGLSICLPPPPPPPQGGLIGETCDNQKPCNQGLVCVTAPNNNSFCFEKCIESLPCLQGGICIRRRGGIGQCICQDDSQCPTDRTCKELETQTFACVCKDPKNCRRCGDSVCDAQNGENCENCPNDCACAARETCVSGACTQTCGDGRCGNNEDCSNCPQDCKCNNNELCNNGRCSTCGNGTCDSGENCSSCPIDCDCSVGLTCLNARCTSPSCGNNSCEPNKGENCDTCPEDCACVGEEVCRENRCVLLCGDGTCEKLRGENCTTCPQDCGCPSGQACISGSCGSNCGDGRCESFRGENCTSCPQDCGCPTSRVCRGGTCLDANTACSGPGRIVCNPPSPCKIVCDPKGCSCSHSPQKPEPFAFLYLFSLLLFFNLKRKATPKTKHQPTK